MLSTEMDLSRAAILGSLTDIVQRVASEMNLATRELTENMPLFDADADGLGMDSFDALKIVTEVELSYNIEFNSSSDIERMRTVGDIITIIQRLKGELA